MSSFPRAVRRRRVGRHRDARLAVPAAGQAESDTAGARKVFEANIDAIHKRDRARYLSYYIQSETLARNGTGGLEQGYKDWAAIRDNTWPDTLVARDLRMVPIAPGVVYGTYHYRQVVHNGPTIEGISERIFVKTPKGWKIAVSTAFGLSAGASPPPVALVGATLVNPGPAGGAERDGGRARRAHRVRGRARGLPRSGGSGDDRCARKVCRPRIDRRARALFTDRVGGRPSRRARPALAVPVRLRGRGAAPRSVEVRPRVPLQRRDERVRRRRLSVDADDGARSRVRVERSADVGRRSAAHDVRHVGEHRGGEAVHLHEQRLGGARGRARARARWCERDQGVVSPGPRLAEER